MSNPLEDLYHSEHSGDMSTHSAGYAASPTSNISTKKTSTRKRKSPNDVIDPRPRRYDEEILGKAFVNYMREYNRIGELECGGSTGSFRKVTLRKEIKLNDDSFNAIKREYQILVKEDVSPDHAELQKVFLGGWKKRTIELYTGYSWFRKRSQLTGSLTLTKPYFVIDSDVEISGYKDGFLSHEGNTQAMFDRFANSKDNRGVEALFVFHKNSSLEGDDSDGAAGSAQSSAKRTGVNARRSLLKSKRVKSNNVYGHPDSGSSSENDNGVPAKKKRLSTISSFLTSSSSTFASDIKEKIFQTNSRAVFSKIQELEDEGLVTLEESDKLLSPTPVVPVEKIVSTITPLLGLRAERIKRHLIHLLDTAQQS